MLLFNVETSSIENLNNFRLFKSKVDDLFLHFDIEEKNKLAKSLNGKYNSTLNCIVLEEFTQSIKTKIYNFFKKKLNLTKELFEDLLSYIIIKNNQSTLFLLY